MPPSGGTGMRSERLVPSSLPSLPRPRGALGCGGSVAAAFGHLLPPEGPSRGWRGRRQRRAGTAAASRLHRRIMRFSLYPAEPLSAGAGGRGFGFPRPGTEHTRPGRAQPCPLPLSATSQTFLSWLLGRAGGGERWGRG